MGHLEIRTWDDGRVLYAGEAESIKALLEKAVAEKTNLNGANLDGANLYRANLDGANLNGANLNGANLYRANLYRANLDGANLNGANLDGANLNGANLDGANLYRANLYRANLDGAKSIPWQSHTFLSEILWRAAAGDREREMVAAWIGRKTSLCWDKFLSLDHPQKSWALAELAKWVGPDDGAPDEMRDLAAKLCPPVPAADPSVTVAAKEE